MLISGLLCVLFLPHSPRGDDEQRASDVRGEDQAAQHQGQREEDLDLTGLSSPVSR
jgi:hypothetical protein